MNIFFLDRDPTLAAQKMTNTHVVKMQLESMQLLSTAVRITRGEFVKVIDDIGQHHYINVLEGERVLFMDVLEVSLADGSKKKVKLKVGDKMPRGSVSAELVSQKPYYDP